MLFILRLYPRVSTPWNFTHTSKMEVTVTDVHKHNIMALLPTIRKSISDAQFVALDTELSGIGCHRDLMAPSIEDRYAGIAKVRAIALLSITPLRLHALAPCCHLGYLALFLSRAMVQIVWHTLCLCSTL